MSREIHVACCDGDLKAVQKAIPNLEAYHRATLRDKPHGVWTLLHSACECEDPSVLKYLLFTIGADPRAMTLDTEVSALHVACMWNRPAHAESLLDHTPILLERRNRLHETPLIIACKGPNVDLVRLLIRRGANIHARDIHKCSPLHNAVKLGCPELVELVVDKDTVNSEDVFGNSPLSDACSYPCQSLGVVQALIRHGATPKSAYYILNKCRGAEGRKVAECLVDTFKLDIHGHDTPWNRTLLHLASIRDDYSMAKFLVARGADTTARDEDGKTPLDLAREHECESVVDLLSA